MHQQLTAFENIEGKGEIAHNEQFLLFLQCFLFNHIIVSLFVYIFDIISLFAAEFEEPNIGIWGKGLNTACFISMFIKNWETRACSFQKSCVAISYLSHDTFWYPWETSLLKTPWEKEKLLVTSNFSFSHSVFYLFG